MPSSLLVPSHLILTRTLGDRKISTFCKMRKIKAEKLICSMSQRESEMKVWDSCSHSLNYYVMYKSSNTGIPKKWTTSVYIVALPQDSTANILVCFTLDLFVFASITIILCIWFYVLYLPFIIIQAFPKSYYKLLIQLCVLIIFMALFKLFGLAACGGNFATIKIAAVRFFVHRVFLYFEWFLQFMLCPV